jgi:hypothetical protein
MRQRCLVWTVAATATACASALHHTYSTDPTIEVRNEGPAAVDLHLILGVSVAGDTIGYLLGTAFAGKTECFLLQSNAAPQWLKIRTVDGTIITPSFFAASRAAWLLDLHGNPRTDLLALEPADEKCRPGTPSRTG